MTPTAPTEREPKRYTIRSAWNASILKELDPSMHIVPESVYLAAIRERDEARRERDDLAAMKYNAQDFEALQSALTASVARSRELEGLIREALDCIEQNQYPYTSERLHAILHPPAPAPNVNDL